MFDLILRILILTCFAYLTLNTFLHFHISIDRILLLIFVIILIALYLCLDTNYLIELLILIDSLLIAYIVLKIISIKKKKHGYFFFNIYKKQYSELNKHLLENSEEFDIDKSNISHHLETPMFVVISNEDIKKTDNFIKKINKIYQKKPKKLTMYNYWFVIGFITILVIILRF